MWHVFRLLLVCCMLATYPSQNGLEDILNALSGLELLGGLTSTWTTQQPAPEEETVAAEYRRASTSESPMDLLQLWGGSPESFALEPEPLQQPQPSPLPSPSPQELPGTSINQLAELFAVWGSGIQNTPSSSVSPELSPSDSAELILSPEPEIEEQDDDQIEITEVAPPLLSPPPQFPPPLAPIGSPPPSSPPPNSPPPPPLMLPNIAALFEISPSPQPSPLPVTRNQAGGSTVDNVDFSQQLLGGPAPLPSPSPSPSTNLNLQQLRGLGNDLFGITTDPQSTRDQSKPLDIQPAVVDPLVEPTAEDPIADLPTFFQSTISPVTPSPQTYLGTYASNLQTPPTTPFLGVSQSQNVSPSTFFPFPVPPGATLIGNGSSTTGTTFPLGYGVPNSGVPVNSGITAIPSEPVPDFLAGVTPIPSADSSEIPGFLLVRGTPIPPSTSVAAFLTTPVAAPSPQISATPPVVAPTTPVPSTYQAPNTCTARSDNPGPGTLCGCTNKVACGFYACMEVFARGECDNEQVSQGNEEVPNGYCDVTCGRCECCPSVFKQSKNLNLTVWADMLEAVETAAGGGTGPTSSVTQSLSNPSYVATVFVPTDEAFRRLYEDQQGQTREQFLSKVPPLQQIVQTHMLLGPVAVTAQELRDGELGYTLATQLGGRTSAFLSIDEGTSIETMTITSPGSTARIVQPDVNGCLSILHLIDEVLLPYEPESNYG